MAQQTAHVLRRIGRQRGPVWFAPEDRDNGIGCGGTRKRKTAGQHFIEHTAECPDIRALVDRLTARLLGTHVRRCSDDPPRFRYELSCHRAGIAGRARHRCCEAEIQDLDVAGLRQLDVGGLQIAVNDPRLVRRIERLGDLAGDAEDFGQRQTGTLGPRPCNPVGQRRTLDQFHNQGGDGAGVLDAEYRRDVGMMQRGKQPRLALEPAAAIRILCHRLGQDLDRDVPTEPVVARAVNLTHPARVQRGEDFVGTKSRTGVEGHWRVSGLYPSSFRDLRESVGPGLRLAQEDLPRSYHPQRTIFSHVSAAAAASLPA
jgi:hypothetical protein